MLRPILRTIAIISIGTGLQTCKPRVNSNVADAEAAMEAADKMNAAIFLIDQRARAFRSYPLLNDAVLDQAEKDNGKVNIPAPSGCSNEIWQKEIVWKNDFLEFLVREAEFLAPGTATTAIPVSEAEVPAKKQESFFEVRMKALSTLADLGSRNKMMCWQNMVDDLLKKSGDLPPREKLAKPNVAPNRKWLCTTFLHCSQALETATIMVRYHRNSEALFDFIKRIRDDILSLEFSPALTDILDLRINSLIAFRSLMKDTNLLNDDFLGTTLSPTSEQVKFLKEWYDGLIAQYDTTLSRLNSEERFNAMVRPQLYEQFISNELFEEKKIFEELSKEQQEFITGYVTSIVQTATLANEFNHAVFEYLDRFNQKNPRPWINKILKRTMAFRALINAQEWAKDPDSAFSDEAKAALYRQKGFEGLHYDQAGEGPLNPLYAFKALVSFYEQEVYLPYRADFVEAIRRTFEMMHEDQRAAMFPDVKKVAAFTDAYKQLFNGYAYAYVGIAMDGQALDAGTKQVIDEAQSMFSRILQKEADIASAPGMATFQSLHHEFLDYSRRMVRRTVALNEYFTFFQDEKLSGWDKFVSPRDKIEIHRMFFAPGTGSDALKFKMEEEHFGLISQWIVINCLDRMFNGGALKFNKKFFLDGTPITFQCQKGENLTDLKMRALKYTSGIALDKTKKALWEAVRNNPFLHAAQMLILSTVVGPLGGKVFQLIGRIGSLAYVPTAFQTIWAMRLISAARYCLDSYIFGIAEHYAGKGIDMALGVKYSEEEEKLHGNPFTNVSGVATGALIFWLIPQAHHGADYLARASLKNVIKRKWALNIASGASQYAAETALFTWNPIEIGLHKANELYQLNRQEYHEPSEMEKLLLKIHGQSTLQRLLGSMVTAGVFNVHRFSGNVLHSSGLPQNIRNELAYFGVRSMEALGKHRDIQKENLYELLHVDRNATEEDILYARETHRKAIFGTYERMKERGLRFTAAEEAELDVKMKKIDDIVAILLGQPGWAGAAATPERAYLKVERGNPRAQHDLQIYGKDKQKRVEGDHDYIAPDVPDARPRANN